MYREFSLLDDICDAFYALDREWRLTYLNHKAETEWGRQRDELLGKVIWEEFPQTVGTLLQREHQRAARERQDVIFETLLPTRQQWVEYTICPNPDGLSVYFYDISDRKQAEIRDKIRRETVAELSKSLTPPEVAQVITEKALAGLGAQTSMVGLLTEDQQQVRLVNADHMRLDVFKDYEYMQLNATNPLTEAVRTGSPVWIRNLDEYVTRYPALAQNAQSRTGTQSSACLPLIVDGRTIGGLAVTFTTPQAFAAAEQAFLTTIAHHCAQALERAWLYEAEHRSRLEAERQTEQFKRLHQVAAEVSHALTINQVLNAIVDHGFALLGAVRGGIGLLAEDGTGIQVRRITGYNQAMVEKFAWLPLTAALPMVDAARTGQPVIIQSPAEYQERYPELVAQLDVKEKSQAAVTLPLQIQGHILGSIGISFTEPQTFTPADIEFMQILAQHCAEGLERVRLYEVEAQARIASELAETNARLQAEITRREGLEAELRANLKQAEELNELKSRFVSMVSHEFRTPLSVMMSSSELLRRYYYRMDDGQRVEHLDRIKAHIHYLTQLVETVLNAGQGQSKRFQFNPSAVDIQALGREVITEMQFITEDSHHLIFTSPGTCGEFWLDRQLIYLMMSNLLTNAVKYSPDTSDVLLKLQCDEHEIVLEVQDTGIGIPEADLPRLFEPFFRATNTATIAGMGVGLSVVRDVVKLHDGTIAVTSQVGVGTTFTVRLPARRP